MAHTLFHAHGVIGVTIGAGSPGWNQLSQKETIVLPLMEYAASFFDVHVPAIWNRIVFTMPVAPMLPPEGRIAAGPDCDP
jgi:hypothetical protein